MAMSTCLIFSYFMQITKERRVQQSDLNYIHGFRMCMARKWVGPIIPLCSPQIPGVIKYCLKLVSTPRDSYNLNDEDK